jgi:predicted nucleic acid-binding protein
VRWGCGLLATPSTSSGLIVTATKVVDASAIAALLFQEPNGEAMARQLEGFRLVAPSLFRYELANVCWLKRRRFPVDQDMLMDAFSRRGGLNIDELAVDHDGVVRLAAETGLTAYDASYLWLARRLGAELVTLDAALLRAAI